MGRNSWIMFGVIAVIVISLVLVALLIFVPQGQHTVVDIYDEYGNFDQSDYTYTKSKDISEEAMKETYSVTSEDIKEGKAAKIYKQGNTNPFAAATDSTAGGNSSSGSGSGGNSSVSPYSADDK